MKDSKNTDLRKAETPATKSLHDIKVLIATDFTNYFICEDGTKISPFHVCDGKSDCKTMIDEHICINSIVYKKWFSCPEINIPYHHVCDTIIHCKDSKDEAGCQYRNIQLYAREPNTYGENHDMQSTCVGNSFFAETICQYQIKGDKLYPCE